MGTDNPKVDVTRGQHGITESRVLGRGGDVQYNQELFDIAKAGTVGEVLERAGADITQPGGRERIRRR